MLTLNFINFEADNIMLGLNSVDWALDSYINKLY